MIWLFKVDEVFWGNKPKVNEHFLFDINVIEFDMMKYDISLYFPSSNYYLLNDSNDKEIYKLEFVGVNINPARILISDGSEIYDVVINYYIKNKII
jgi:hypothetical protein